MDGCCGGYGFGHAGRRVVFDGAHLDQLHAVFENAKRRVCRRGQCDLFEWLEKLGPKACLLSWLPGVGDPLCAVAGWLKMPFGPCVIYMAIGKFLRYMVMTSLLLWVF